MDKCYICGSNLEDIYIDFCNECINDRNLTISKTNAKKIYRLTDEELKSNNFKTVQEKNGVFKALMYVLSEVEAYANIYHPDWNYRQILLEEKRNKKSEIIQKRQQQVILIYSSHGEVINSNKAFKYTIDAYVHGGKITCFGLKFKDLESFIIYLDNVKEKIIFFKDNDYTEINEYYNQKKIILDFYTDDIDKLKSQLDDIMNRYLEVHGLIKLYFHTKINSPTSCVSCVLDASNYYYNKIISKFINSYIKYGLLNDSLRSDFDCIIIYDLTLINIDEISYDSIKTYILNTSSRFHRLLKRFKKIKLPDKMFNKRICRLYVKYGLEITAQMTKKNLESSKDIIKIISSE